MGLGRHGGGAAAARFLAGQGAIVTVTDLADADALADSLAGLADAGIGRFHLGGHRESDFQAADLVVVNPAVRPGDPLVELARKSGARLTSEAELFLDACPARVIGVTGTNGKSTSAAMTAAILSAAGRRTWLGGNIGNSLLAELHQLRPDDWVVLELSSFQLFWLSDAARWPSRAIVTNCTPNHLDWHGTFAHYMQAKQRLLEHLSAVGSAVIDPRAPGLTGWADSLACRLIEPVPLQKIPPLQLPGEHNRRNAALAAAAALDAGVEWGAVETALARFSGLPHRLALVAEIAGRKFFDDSKSTTPEATLAALDAMRRPTWLLLGQGNRPGPIGHGGGTTRVRGGRLRRRRPAVGSAVRQARSASRLPRGSDFGRGAGLVLEPIQIGRGDSAFARLRQPRSVPRLRRSGRAFRPVGGQFDRLRRRRGIGIIVR
jgi:UDP-N-acetylmuramoylalanine--D-glutamate ligase